MIEDNKYDALLVHIETGAKGDLSEDLIKYLSFLELIRSMHMRYENRMTIIRFLQQSPYNLSEYQATKYFSDAINFFFLDIQIKKQAYRNMIADDLSRAASLCLKTAKSSKDLDIYKNIKLAEFNARQLNEPEKEDIPEAFFNKKYKIYTLDPRKVGRTLANRNKLAQHIDSLNIPEADKQRVKKDAMIEDIDFLEEYED